MGSLASGVLPEALRNAWQRLRKLTPGVQHRESTLPVRSARTT
jgi:hypothetical protein